MRSRDDAFTFPFNGRMTTFSGASLRIDADTRVVSTLLVVAGGSIHGAPPTGCESVRGGIAGQWRLPREICVVMAGNGQEATQAWFLT